MASFYNISKNKIKSILPLSVLMFRGFIIFMKRVKFYNNKIKDILIAMRKDIVCSTKGTRVKLKLTPFYFQPEGRWSDPVQPSGPTGAWPPKCWRRTGRSYYPGRSRWKRA